MRAQHRGARFPLGGKPLDTSLKLDDNWFALGVSTKEPERIQGYHNKNVLIIIDEASGVPQGIFDAAENAMSSSGNVRMLLLGNPSMLSGEFYNAFHSKRSIYNLIHIADTDTPNVRAGRSIIPGLITKEWSDEKLRIWGKDSPLYQVKVKGNFPSTEYNSVVPIDWVEQAFDRWSELPGEGPFVIGCDPARYGDCETVIVVRQGLKIAKIIPLVKKSGPEIEECLKGLATEYMTTTYGKARINIEAIGSDIGSGIYDHLLKDSVAEGYTVEDVNVGRPADNPEKFANLRAELWWKLRTLLDPQSQNKICLPHDDVLAGQLTSVRFKVPVGRIQIESKEIMRARGVPSPDRADALMLSFYQSEYFEEVLGDGGCPIHVV